MADVETRFREFEEKSGLDTETATVAGSFVPSDPPALQDLPIEDFPDGGKEAWTVVLGACLALFASAGMVNTYVSSRLSLWVRSR